LYRPTLSSYIRGFIEVPASILSSAASNVMRCARSLAEAKVSGEFQATGSNLAALVALKIHRVNGTSSFAEAQASR
jgi:hypothetical protein